MSNIIRNKFRWLTTGDDFFAALLKAIDSAQESVRLEVYIFTRSALGTMVRDRLVSAAARGVNVRVLIDYSGSQPLATSFWNPLVEVGGSFRWFNPSHFRPVRDHRKLFVADDVLGLVGGYNISEEYCGDGVLQGWRDLGLQMEGILAKKLAIAFDAMFELAPRRPRRFARFRKRARGLPLLEESAQLVLGIPGRGRGAIGTLLTQDLARARRVRIIVPYFLPGVRMRRVLHRVCRKGGQLDLLVPGKNDVPIARLAGQSFYEGLLHLGASIYEYQPQVLHAKLYIIDEVTYIGSCNLDPRSLHLNYELLVRLTDPDVVAGAVAYFEETLRECKPVERISWHSGRGILQKIRERFAVFLLSRVDPYLTRWLTE